MVFITVKDYKNAGEDVIKDSETNDIFWVKMKNVQNGLGTKNIRKKLRTTMQDILGTKKLIEEQKQQYIRTENEINKNLKNNLYKYARNDIIEKVIKNCRGVKKSNDGVKRLDKEKQRENFRKFLGFKENEVFENKECSIVKQIKKVFKRQKIIDQYFIDLYFPEHKLVIDTFDKTSEIENLIYESGIKLGEKLNKNKIIEDLERSVKIIKMSE